MQQTLPLQHTHLSALAIVLIDFVAGHHKHTQPTISTWVVLMIGH
jgi:hypothetical protein